MHGHIVITGATGVIGTELALRLIARGESVVVFARLPGVAARNIPGAGEYVQWDSGMDGGDWTGFINGAKAVIHLAGKPLLESRWTEAHKNECYSSRVLGTRHIVSAIASASEKPQVFISASAIGYYGSFSRCDDTPAMDESAPEGRDFLAKICIDWEKEALAAEKSGPRTVLLRTGIVLSTKGGMLQKMLPTFRLFLGGPIGSGLQCISWIHIDDEIAAILEVLDNPLYRGAINLVSPTPVTMKKFAEALAAVLDRPAQLPVPEFVVHLLMGEGAEYAVKGQKITPGFLMAQHFPFLYQSLSDALADLIAHKK